MSGKNRSIMSSPSPSSASKMKTMGWVLLASTLVAAATALEDGGRLKVRPADGDEPTTPKVFGGSSLHAKTNGAARDNGTKHGYSGKPRLAKVADQFWRHRHLTVTGDDTDLAFGSDKMDQGSDGIASLSLRHSYMNEKPNGYGSGSGNGNTKPNGSTNTNHGWGSNTPNGWSNDGRHVGSTWGSKSAKKAKSAKSGHFMSKAQKAGKAKNQRADTKLPHPSCITDSDTYKATLAHAQCLYQSDFEDGSVIIKEPGTWKLCENISFAPRKPDPHTATDEEIANAFNPTKGTNEAFDGEAFSMGYFAAICVEADNVTLLLNGFTIQQDPSHALMQRFFAIIETASAPFVPMAGPGDFVGDGEFRSAKNFELIGPGTLGLSSHHGIHGNNNEDVTVCDVTFVDFEVAAVSLNNVDRLTIKECHIPHNRHDVPVLGMFSAARQILPYVKAMKDWSAGPYEMPLAGVQTSSSAVYNALVKSIADVYRDVMKTGYIDKDAHPAEHKLFHNVHKAVDGPCYAFLVHGLGPAVGGQGFEMHEDSTVLSSDVDVSDNTIENIKCWTNEIPSVVIGGLVQNDVRGGVIQLISTIYNEWLASDADGHYIGNVLIDAQMMVADACHNSAFDFGAFNLQERVSTVAIAMVHWARAGNTDLEPQFRCNGDSMHHVIKGSIMMRIEDTQGFKLSNNVINNVQVLSNPGAATEEYFAKFPEPTLQWACETFHVGASIEYGDEPQLANLRGISVAAVSKYLDSSESIISGNKITNFDSEFANEIIGIDISGMSEGIVVSHNYVDLKHGVGTDTTDKYVGCRVRSYATQGEIVKIDNELAQEEEWEVQQEAPENHPGSEVLLEWTFQGCPYGRPRLDDSCYEDPNSCK